VHKTLYKTLCVAVLFVIALAFMSGSKSVGSAPPALTAPVIVASGRLINQSGNFTSTIYTPGVSGVYRLSAYATLTTADPLSKSYSYYGFSWTDATGTPLGPVYQLTANSDAVAGPFDDYVSGFILGGFTRTFQATKGTPITHTMYVTPVLDNSLYSVYYVLERIE
jgi:hypothetical protein